LELLEERIISVFAAVEEQIGVGKNQKLFIWL